MSNVGYPVHQYARESDEPSFDPLLKNKYIRLRRMLREFRSHSKGQLAKYEEKIEDSRVLKNKLGEKILLRLIEDGILYKDGVMYILDTDKMASELGINWHDFRLGKIPDSLVEYLKSIDYSSGE
jgi:hypothetical protein